jgi:hypothetical protein
MKVSPFPHDYVPIKLDSKQYVGKGADGCPVLIRVDPCITEYGEVVTDWVKVYMDEKGHQQMHRAELEVFLECSSCVPLEIKAQWKHHLKN